MLAPPRTYPHAGPRARSAGLLLAPPGERPDYAQLVDSAQPHRAVSVVLFSAEDPGFQALIAPVRGHRDGPLIQSGF